MPKTDQRTVSPINFITIIIAHIRDKSKWTPTNSLDNTSLYLRNYLDYLYQIRSCNYILNFNSRSGSYETTVLHRLTEYIIVTHKFIDNNEQTSLTDKLATHLPDSVKFNQ
ncbi:MAG: hypothetical protein ACL7BU_15350 [Candidatus Phlomobacter fragariae]